MNWSWARDKLKEGYKVRRKDWPNNWRVWLMEEYRQPTHIDYWDCGLISGWGNQIGAIDEVDEFEGMRDGRVYRPSLYDITATDWEFL